MRALRLMSRLELMRSTRRHSRRCRLARALVKTQLFDSVLCAKSIEFEFVDAAPCWPLTMSDFAFVFDPPWGFAIITEFSILNLVVKLDACILIGKLIRRLIHVKWLSLIKATMPKLRVLLRTQSKQISSHRRASHHHRHVAIKLIKIKPNNVLLKTLLNVLLIIHSDDNWRHSEIAFAHNTWLFNFHIKNVWQKSIECSRMFHCILLLLTPIQMLMA